MSNSRTVLSVAALLIVCSTSGAQIFKHKLAAPKEPTITYNRVEVKKVTFQKASVDFVFVVDNPNSFGIDRSFLLLFLIF